MNIVHKLPGQVAGDADRRSAGAALGGRGRRHPRPDLPRAARAHQPVRQRAAVAGPRLRAIASRSSCRCARSWWRRSSPWSRRAASCCRSSPGTAWTPCRRASRTRARGSCSPPTASGGAVSASRCGRRPMPPWRPLPASSAWWSCRGWATRRRWDRVMSPGRDLVDVAERRVRWPSALRPTPP